MLALLPLGYQELQILLMIGLLLFAGELFEAGRSLGRTVTGFMRDSMSR